MLLFGSPQRRTSDFVIWLLTGFRSAVATSRAHRRETRADSPNLSLAVRRHASYRLCAHAEAALLHGGRALSSASITVWFVAILQMLHRQGDLVSIARRKAWLAQFFNRNCLVAEGRNKPLWKLCLIPNPNRPV